MKYQSELIKEIVESRGHELSSLHYESECVEKWVEEAKGAYPKLCDYQSEWLNYINENPLGKFPYETVTDVTEATVNNVVPYEYKSAILKGQTLVNLFDGEKMALNEASFYTYSNGIIEGVGDGQAWSSKTNMCSAIKPMTKYLFKVKNIGEYDLNVQIRTDLSVLLHSQSVSVGQEVIRIIQTGEKIDGLYAKVYPQTTNNGILARAKVNIIEYQEGMENWDIPYFEGMQSVRMPVLTTSNEDGTKTNILTVNEDVTLRSNGNICDELNLLTGQLTQRIDEDGEVLSQEVVKTVDLNIQDQDGNTLRKIKPIEGTMHIHSDGTPLKPSITMEIPVEATTQNLSSFIKEE